MLTRGPVRPVDAAGLILLRGSREAPEILLGRRHSKTAFLPDIYVVPGGRVDAEDLTPSGFPEAAHPAVAADLAFASRRPPLAFLRAALRETHEETGLLVGRGAASNARSGAFAAGSGVWSCYRAAGLAPDFASLDFVLRAITPRESRRRYNTRFFLADGSAAQGVLAGNGELLDLAWRPVGSLEQLNIVDVTWELIRTALRRWRDRAPVGAERPKLLIYRNNILALREFRRARPAPRKARRA